MQGIYQIRNVRTNKVYVGSSIDIQKRWAEHRKSLNNARHPNKHLLRAWQRDGSANFSFEALEGVIEKTDLIAREQYWIDKTFCTEDAYGYNFCPTAGNSLGRVVSVETRIKISKAVKGKGLGRVVSDETRKRLSMALTGRVFSPVHCSRISKSKQGKPTHGTSHTVATKQRLSELASAKMGGLNPFFGREHNHESKRKMSESKGKGYKAISPSGEIYVFKSMKAFCREMGLDQVTMNAVARGVYRQCKGWTAIKT